MKDKSRKREGSKKPFYAVTSVFILLLVLLFSARFFARDEVGPSGKPRAVIVDGLLNYPNPKFVEKSSEILRGAGYEVDLVSGDEVNVDFYRRLPSLGYRFIILRVHCGPLYRQLNDGSKIPVGNILFTTEAYDSRKYLDYQINEQVAVAKINGIPNKEYFAVPPWFFEQVAEGRFQNATLVLDSCYGFYDYSPLMMAKSLESRGVKIFIGWDGEVQPEHADSAVLVLLESLFVDGLDVREAVGMVMKEAGPDPYFGSVMVFYPLDKGDYILKAQN